VSREGELDVSAFLETLKKTFDLEMEPEPPGTALELAPRPPALCAGCSHRANLLLASKKRSFGKEAIYPSDIGCYTLGISERDCLRQRFAWVPSISIRPQGFTMHGAKTPYLLFYRGLDLFPYGHELAPECDFQ